MGVLCEIKGCSVCNAAEMFYHKSRPGIFMYKVISLILDSKLFLEYKSDTFHPGFM